MTTVQGSAIECNDLADDRSQFPPSGFVLRDVSRVDAVRKPAATLTRDRNTNVMELEGPPRWKEIVQKTTDVVEKMMHRTPLDPDTQQNRVAAAEMLAACRRKSLYVKLRKYGAFEQKDAGRLRSRQPLPSTPEPLLFSTIWPTFPGVLRASFSCVDSAM